MSLFEFSETPFVISTVVSGSGSLDGGGVGEGGGVTDVVKTVQIALLGHDACANRTARGRRTQFCLTKLSDFDRPLFFLQFLF